MVANAIDGTTIQYSTPVLQSTPAKMGERLGRQALLFREEPEPEAPTLKGLTLCEQLVFLHQMNILTTLSGCGLKINENLPQRVLSAAGEENLGFYDHNE